MFQELNYGAGICKDQTQLAAKARWYDCNFIRFRDGLPECIGGWSALPYADIPLNFNNGVPRAIKQWNALDGTPLIAVGTSSALFVILAGIIYDITPIVETSTLTNEITTTMGSSIITITDAGYGPVAGQAIIISGASAVGGIPAPALNQTLVILTIVSGTQYTVDTGTVATSGATGGGTFTVNYELAPGAIDAGSSGGYGNGPYGSGPYGQTTGSGDTTQPRLWYLDNYGQDLVATVRDGGVYYWTYTLGTSVHAVNLTTLGDGDTPQIAKFVQVAPSTQSLIAFGTDVLGNLGVEDPMMIRWSAPGSATIWTPTVTTPAGFQRLSSGSQIVRADATVGPIVILTDETAYAMQYVGPPVVYSFSPIGQHTNIVSPNAGASLGSATVWMGYDNFFTYTGNVYPLPCEVRDYVFSNINAQQSYKFFAAVNRRFDEVWWFYVSSQATEIDRYVMYSFVEQVWSIGMLSRTAWSDEQGNPYPIATDANAVLYAHEYGTDANGTALMPYVLSSEQSIQQGDRIGMVKRALPDIFFRNNPLAGPMPPPQSATIQFLWRDSSDLPFQSSAQFVVNQNSTDYLYPRFRGRNVAVQIASNSIGTSWRAGIQRIDLISDGAR